MEVGVLALATLLQAYCNVGNREVVELTVLDKRWQLVLDCLGAEQPPFSQSTLFNFRMRLIAHDLDKRLLERTVALAEQTGGFGARQLRAAQELGTSAEAILTDADLMLVGQSSIKAALDFDWGEPTMREHALRLVLAEGPGGKDGWSSNSASLSINRPCRR